MRVLWRWTAMVLLGLALGLSGCGFGANDDEGVENEQVLPGQAGDGDEGDEGGEGGAEGDD